MARLPLVLKTHEFAYLLRWDEETVRRMIRRRELKATGRPARIPVRELIKFGVTLEDAALALEAHIKKPPGLLEAA
jgi:hypothetical protein